MPARRWKAIQRGVAGLLAAGGMELSLLTLVPSPGFAVESVPMASGGTDAVTLLTERTDPSQKAKFTTPRCMLENMKYCEGVWQSQYEGIVPLPIQVS